MVKRSRIRDRTWCAPRCGEASGHKDGRTMRTVAIVIERADRNYSTYAPEFPGCMATGATAKEAENNMRGARSCSSKAWPKTAWMMARLEEDTVVHHQHHDDYQKRNTRTPLVASHRLRSRNDHPTGRATGRAGSGRLVRRAHLPLRRTQANAARRR